MRSSRCSVNVPVNAFVFKRVFFIMKVTLKRFSSILNATSNGVLLNMILPSYQAVSDKPDVAYRRTSPLVDQ